MAPWHPLQFLQYNTCVMLPEIMLKRVQLRTSTVETQQVSMNGSSALDYAVLVNLVICKLKRRLKHVMDCVATLSSRYKKLASIICAQLSVEDHVVSTRLSTTCEGMVLPFTDHELRIIPTVLSSQRTRVQTNGESYFSRRRHCWTLLTQMDPVMHLSEGHRSDM